MVPRRPLPAATATAAAAIVLYEDVGAVLVAHLLGHVGHDLGRLAEAADDLVLPLVDQHTVL